MTDLTKQQRVHAMTIGLGSLCGTRGKYISHILLNKRDPIKRRVTCKLCRAAIRRLPE